jgi:single-strand DNA-binding protein
MANSVNKVTLLGNLGNDPDIRTTQSGSTIATISLATSENYKDKSGNWQENTDWHKVKLWDKLAERASQYLKKGSKVYIEGRLKYGSYEKDGITRYTTDIVAYQLIMLDRREGGGGSQGGGEYTSSKNYSQNNSDSGSDNDDFDDDVPF